MSPVRLYQAILKSPDYDISSLCVFLWRKHNTTIMTRTLPLLLLACSATLNLVCQQWPIDLSIQDDIQYDIQDDTQDEILRHGISGGY